MLSGGEFIVIEAYEKAIKEGRQKEFERGMWRMTFFTTMLLAVAILFV